MLCTWSSNFHGSIQKLFTDCPRLGLMSFLPTRARASWLHNSGETSSCFSFSNPPFFINSSSECSFCAGHFAFLARDPARGHLDSHSQCLECALCPVVVIVTADAVDMHGHSGTLGKALHAMRHHLTAQLAQPLALQTELDDAVWTIRQVDNGPGQGLVEGSVCVTEPCEASRGAESLGKGVTESDADVFGCVMVVDYNYEYKSLVSREDRSPKPRGREEKTDCEGRPGS